MQRSSFLSSGSLVFCSPSARVLLGALALLAGCVVEAGTPGAGSDDDGAGGGATAASTTGVGGGASSSTSTGAGGEEPVIPPINAGFIGGPCAADTDCPYEGGFCLFEAEGFPDGMCSLDCPEFCPDQEGAVSTFCVAPAALGTTADAGLCTTRCDYGQSPTGCRPGYQCQPHARFSDPEVQVYTCVPGEDAPFQLGACHQELLARSIPFTPAVNPKDRATGNQNIVCDIVDPIWIDATLSGIPFHAGSLSGAANAIFTNCNHGLAMADASEVLANAGVDAVVHYGIYNCRVIAGTSTLSQHGLANAIDIAGLRMEGGAYYTVLNDYQEGNPNPTAPGAAILRDFVETLYDDQIYNIILTPDYNAAHRDHFHCDLTPGAHTLQ